MKSLAQVESESKLDRKVMGLYSIPYVEIPRANPVIDSLPIN